MIIRIIFFHGLNFFPGNADIKNDHPFETAIGLSTTKGKNENVNRGGRNGQPNQVGADHGKLW